MAQADEIIEDYASSLEWLHTNDRYAINNFTVIAKENTEHSEAISSVLMDHIAKAHPNHKLPALYVLDSIAKNIGTPYTLFLGNRLYTTFMGAYSLVDHGVRKKLDEMLKTWKQPVPGSLDSRPVFPPDVTKKIENALIQVKTRTLQVEQQQQREQQDLLRRRTPNSLATPQWRNTPTPPQNGPRFPVPSSQGFVAFMESSNTFQRPTSSLYHPPTPYAQNTQHFVPSVAPGSNHHTLAPPSNDLGTLKRDVQILIGRFEGLIAHNYNDTGLQIKLKALRDLQTVLNTQDLPAEQLRAVRAQVDALSASQLPIVHSNTPVPVTAPSPAYSMPSLPTQVAYQPHHNHYQSMPQLPDTTPVPVPPVSSALPPEIPSTDFLARLLAGRTNTPSSVQKGGGPPPQSPDTTSVPGVSGESSLISQLRASGLLGAATEAPSGGGTTGPNIQFRPGVSSIAPAPIADLSALIRPALVEKTHNVELSSASLKKPRPHLIESLYGNQPNQCLSCGKRFLSTDEGRSRKSRHMDWHFRTNQRLADAAQRGQSRSWYVDEMEWIRFRDSDEGLAGSDGNGLDETVSDVAISRNDPRSQFIPVPSENDSPCGICQEKFVPSWNEQLQDFVWMDAVKIGDRIYHASCYADFRNDEGHTPARTATPDSVLGKRKAEALSDNVSPAKRVVTQI